MGKLSSSYFQRDLAGIQRHISLNLIDTKIRTRHNLKQEDPLKLKKRKEERKHARGRILSTSFFIIYKYMPRNMTFFLIFLLFCQFFLPSRMPGCHRNLDSAFGKVQFLKLLVLSKVFPYICLFNCHRPIPPNTNWELLPLHVNQRKDPKEKNSKI